MKFRKLIWGVAIVAISLMLFNPAFSEDMKTKPTQEEMMAVYAKYAMPGAEHKSLEPLVGSWECTARMWEDPSAPPTESKGTCETKWILDGRFIQDEVSAVMNGMPFHGMGVTGYDNIKRQFASFWIDEMATSFMLTYGQSDGAGKVFTMYGSYIDPASNLQEKKFKTITRIVNNDQHVYEMYSASPDGKDVKMFELVYIRKK